MFKFNKLTDGNDMSDPGGFSFIFSWSYALDTELS